MTAPAQRLTPVAPSDRVELIDILRGFALIGILVVNFMGDASESTRAFDRFIGNLLGVLVSDSFYPLFSFLFGLGFALQLHRSRERGTGVSMLYLRRLLALFLIGTVHAVVIWWGDILVSYAMLGLLLIPLRWLPDRWLLGLAALPLVLSLWGGEVQRVLNQIEGESGRESQMLARETDDRTLIANARVQRYELDPTIGRWDVWTASVSSQWNLYTRKVRRQYTRFLLFNDLPAFFLIGFVVGRKRILQEATKHKRGLGVAAMCGFLLGVLGTLVVNWLEPDSRWLSSLGSTMGNYGTSLFYVAGISYGVTFHPTVTAVFRRLSPAGRIGLTNYLLQSIVMTVLFSRYGVALDAPSTAIYLALNLVFFFFVQLPFSRWWTARYRFGPAEWVWRSMTYGSRQAMTL